MAGSRYFGDVVRRCSPMREGVESEASPKCFESVLSWDDLRTIRVIYLIPVEFEVELAGPGERVHLPPPGQLGVHDEALKVGLRFLLHSFIVELMKAYVFTPSQIAPNS